MYLAKLGKIDLRVRIERFYVRTSDILWADLIVFCRNTDPLGNKILDEVLSHNKPFIYELDDNFFELSLDGPEGKYHRAPERIAQLEKYLVNSSLVRVYSKILDRHIKKYSANGKYVKAPVNLANIPSIPLNRNSRKV